ncbi:MAG: class I SAM-dependent methyltransferase [Anaerolineae bacterium]
MSEQIVDKREFYNQTEIAGAYDAQRFGGASGAWVNQRELALILSLLPPAPRVLDLGCGTGRLTRALARQSQTVGLDAAGSMLQEARRIAPLPFIQGDAFTLPFADASFDGVTALRLVFHFQALGPLLSEMRRVVKPGGSVVFDTYTWSPRAWRPLDPQKWGGGVFIHSPNLVAQAAQQAGLAVAAQAHAFLFSPYLYRRLPLPLVKLLGFVDTRLPARSHARIFWRLERT